MGLVRWLCCDLLLVYFGGYLGIDWFACCIGGWFDGGLLLFSGFLGTGLAVGFLAMCMGCLGFRFVFGGFGYFAILVFLVVGALI